MKRLNLIIGSLIFVFVVLNVVFFYSSIKLAEEIAFYEKKITDLQTENINLERDLSRLSSLAYARQFTEFLGFVKKAEVYYLDDIKYALHHKNDQN
ncbi:MAG: hypothetical protein NZL96_00195 [Patescibacteria group bacterium]|nr:hypothetical protein [Patescibacteria group bacterium]